MRIFIYDMHFTHHPSGMTYLSDAMLYADRSFWIAPPTEVDYVERLVCSQDRESMTPARASAGWWRSAREKSWSSSAYNLRGHRCGQKGHTLRDHRTGRSAAL